MPLEGLPPELSERLEAARNNLDRKEVDAAVAIYAQVLSEDAIDGDVLAVISGDLGATGNVVPIIQLVGPVYDPELHGSPAGLNLLQAYLAVGDPTAARHVLGTLFALKSPEIRERLHGFANAISEMEKTGAAPAVPGTLQPPAAKGTAVSISKPVWFYGLESLAERILPSKGAGLRRIAFTQLALPDTYEDLIKAMRSPEDEPARLSRAIPLWLAETFHFSTHYSSIAAVGIASEEDGSKYAVLLDADWTMENMRQLVSTTTGGLDYLFTGSLRGRDGVYHLTLRVWEVKGFRERKQFTTQWTPATADEELSAIRNEICRFMECRPLPEEAGKASYRPQAPRSWLDMLASSLGLFLAGKSLVPADRLGPVTAVLERLRAAAAADPIAALAWLTTARRAKDLGLADVPVPPLAQSPIVDEARSVLGY
jgi:hypothetical protein